MKAMLLEGVVDLSREQRPLVSVDRDEPVAGEGQVVVKISACGVCHTELDEIEGRTPPPAYPVVPGHQVIGRVVEIGAGCRSLALGDRVGVAWIYGACGNCRSCRAGLENLCAGFRATGRDADGGYAEYMVVGEDFAIAIPAPFSDIEAAPLLCAGAIGYRSLRLCGLADGDVLGLAGFGASAHLVLKMVSRLFPSTPVIVLARSREDRQFARELGAAWSGDFGETPPLRPRAVIDTTPAWRPVLESLAILEPGGRLVINAIRKEAGDASLLAGLDYAGHLWLEKEVKSVANVTRRDVRDFLALAASPPIRAKVRTYGLAEANAAIADLKAGRGGGAKVLVMD